MKSFNPRLEHIYAPPAPDYFVNREFTLPCVTEEVYRDRSLFENPNTDPHLQSRIDNLLRIIIPATMVDRLTAETREQIRVLASPYECGRVLEDDEPVMIDGIRYVLTTKGSGCTTFIAEENGHSRFYPSDLNHGLKIAPAIQAKMDAEKREELKTYRFSWLHGVLGLHAAMTELERSQALHSPARPPLHTANPPHHPTTTPLLPHHQPARNETTPPLPTPGFDVERVLAIYKILQMPDENGDMRPISYFQEHGIINPHPEYQPIIMIRALRSNFRILDLINLLKLGDDETMKKFIDHVLDEYRLSTGHPTATPTDYFEWFSSHSIDQRISLFLAGYPNTSAQWQTQARNRSVMGESIDLEGGNHGGPYKAHLTSDEHYLDLLESFDFLATGLELYATAINRIYPGAIDLKKLAAAYSEKIKTARIRRL